METVQGIRKAREEVLNAINRLDQKQADTAEKYNQAVQGLSSELVAWSRGELTEEALHDAYTRTNLLKLMADPAPFNLARLSLEREAKRLHEFSQSLMRKNEAQEKASKFKTLFNTAVANGRKLSDAEKSQLRMAASQEYINDLNKLFAALNDYSFKFNNRLESPTFQEYSQIAFYPQAEGN